MTHRAHRRGGRSRAIVAGLALLVAPLCAISPAELPEARQPLPAIEALPQTPPGPWAGRDDSLSVEAMPNLVTPDRRRAPGHAWASDPSEYRTPETVLPPAVPHLASNKNGFFQKLSFTGTEILPDGSDGLGIFETELFAAFAVPAPTRASPLIIIPTLETHFLSGPKYADLPPRLYATYLDFMWLPQVTERLKGIVSVAPGWYSDFEGPDAAWFRLTGRGVARYDWVPECLQVMLGVLYLDRHDRVITPVAGIIWKPQEDWNLELVFPKAKIARRLSWGMGFENWAYLTGGFGGNDWSIHRPGNTRERLTMLDWRLGAGWERKLNGGAGLWFEVGYVFQREFEFVGTGARYEPDDTVLLRVGASY
jgi:hypothetical protein